MAASWLLKDTEIHDLWVLVLAIAVVALTCGLLYRRPSAAAMRRGLILISSVALVGWAILGVIRYRLLLAVCEEGHFVEWLTAHFLLVAWVLGLVLTIRLGLRNRPVPLAVFLTGGGFWAFWRELEFGRCFLGEKCLYTRNFFRLRAYLDAGYFEQFNRSLGHVEPRPLWIMHWIGIAIVVILVVLIGRYLFRYRRRFRRELSRLGRTTCGRYFFLAVGLYIAAQLLEKLASAILFSDTILPYSKMWGLKDRVIGEPIECLAALCFLLSVVALYLQQTLPPVLLVRQSSHKS